MNSSSTVTVQPELSTKDKITFHENKINQIVSMLGDEDNPLRQIYLRPGQKRDIIKDWAEHLEQLHNLNKYKEPVETISSYIKIKMRDLGLESAIPYVHEVLAHKYKGSFSRIEEELISTNEEILDHNSSLNIEPKVENKILIDLLDKEIKLKQSIKNKLGSSHFLNLLTPEEQKTVKEMYQKTWSVIDIAADLFDDRVSCPTLLQYLLLDAHIQATDNFAAGIYVRKVKDFGANRWDEAKQLINKQHKIILEAAPEIKKLTRTLEKLDHKSEKYKEAKQKLTAEELKDRNAKLVIKLQRDKDTMTSKQTMKVLQRRMKNLLPILEPPNRDAALSIGYYGMRCEGCGSYRTYRDVFQGKMFTFCHQCDVRTSAKFASKCSNMECNFPFYEDVVNFMLKKSKEENGAISATCPQCKHPVILSREYLPKVIQ